MSRTARTLLLAGALALAGCGSDASADAHGDHDAHDAPATVEGPDDRFAGIDLPEPYQRPSFTLTDTTGDTYDFAAETGGRPTLLFFGSTNCPDVCPTTMADVAVALGWLEPATAEQVQVVFVTTDPGTDTPEVLGEYLDRFDADLPTQFVGLTGDQATIDQAQLAAGVPLAEDGGRCTRRCCCCTEPRARRRSRSTPATRRRISPATWTWYGVVTRWMSDGATADPG